MTNFLNNFNNLNSVNNTVNLNNTGTLSNVGNKIKIGPTVTMFVPYDCNNACPFCVNKDEYRDTSDFSIERCYKSLDILNRIFPHNDIVLTGGEPLADLDILQDILEHIEDTHNIYINTTLPTNDSQDERLIAKTLNKFKDKISCVNVSRHLRHYVKECSDEIFDMLDVRHRINCVVFEDTNEQKLKAFLDRFKGHEVQLRANYSKLSLDNVFITENDDLFKLISSVANYEGQLEQELFRTGFMFKYDGDTVVTYHKTLPYSKINGKVGDIIIRQTGFIYDDWNNYGEKLDINSLVELPY